MSDVLTAMLNFSNIKDYRQLTCERFGKPIGYNSMASFFSKRRKTLLSRCVLIFLVLGGIQRLDLQATQVHFLDGAIDAPWASINPHKELSFVDQRLCFLPSLLLKNPEAYDREKAIIFLHIPKTGGTNLDKIAEAFSQINEGGPCEFRKKRFAVPRKPGLSPGLINHGWIGGLEKAKSYYSPSSDHCKDFDFISGHFPFGIHELIGNQTKYITLVREPLAREVSSANFDYQRGYVSSEDLPHYLLDVMLDNPQTRLLAGEAFMAGECNEETFERAKANVNKYFLFIGITDDANTFFQAVASLRGWGPVAFAKTQITGKKAIRLSYHLRSQLRSKHQYDIRLYQWIRATWAAWKAKNIIGENPLESGTKIMTLMPEFIKTGIPIQMTKEAIDQYNDALKSEELIVFTQAWSPSST